ncbi:MAG: lipocalin-like domain-containing protein [Acidobacteria bacterium]|nr:lipocalin-like domain-containing protein [Acidobacteriota bacterium]
MPLSRRILLAAPAAAAAEDRFPGVWSLARYELKNKATGAITHPYTEKPVGRITYDREGRMSAQLMHPGRKRLSGDVPGAAAALILIQASASELRELAGGFIAYYGTYRVDEPARTVIHRVEACLIPNWVGTDLIRGYQFEGRNRLTLIAETPAVTGRLIWERA